MYTTLSSVSCVASCRFGLDSDVVVCAVAAGTGHSLSELDDDIDDVVLIVADRRGAVETLSMSVWRRACDAGTIAVFPSFVARTFHSRS